MKINQICIQTKYTARQGMNVCFSNACFNCAAVSIFFNKLQCFYWTLCNEFFLFSLVYSMTGSKGSLRMLVCFDFHH